MHRSAVVLHYCAVGLLLVALPFLPVVHCFHPRPTDPACTDQHNFHASPSSQPHQQRTSLFQSPQQQSRRFGSTATATYAAVKSNNNSNNQERLHFISTIHAVSPEPLPTTDRTQVDAFFRSTTCRNHFLSGGGKNAVREEQRTPELEACWRDACESHYGTQYLPAGEDPILSTETSIQFPGLRIVNRVYSGVKFVDTSCDDNTSSSSGGKEYHSLLIAEQRQVKGPAPLVWLYNQLTGGESKRKKKQQQQQPANGNAEVDSSSSGGSSETGESNGYALTKIYVTELPQESTGGCEYKIGFDCTVEVLVLFPRFLLKILPVSKEKMEEQGSLSVKKAVEKEVMTAIESTNTAFEEWRAASSASIV